MKPSSEVRGATQRPPSYGNRSDYDVIISHEEKSSWKQTDEKEIRSSSEDTELKQIKCEKCAYEIMRLENDLKDEVQKGFSIIHNLLQTQFQLLQSSNSKAPQASPTTPLNKKNSR